MGLVKIKKEIFLCNPKKLMPKAVIFTGLYGNSEHVYLSRDFTFSLIQVLSLSRRSGEIKLISFFAGEKL